MAPNRAEEIYSGPGSAEYHIEKRSIAPQALPWLYELRAKKFRKYIPNDAIVFEYGVGYGWNLARLDCRRKIGCDVSPLLEAEVKKLGIEFVYDPKEIPDASADVVICHHTLEHVASPENVLRQIHRILKSEGKLLLFVPYEKEKRYRRFDRAEPNHHLFSWNVQALGNLAENCGFNVIEAGIQKFRFDRFATRAALKLHLGRTGYFLIRSLALLIAPGYEVRLIASKRE